MDHEIYLKPLKKVEHGITKNQSLVDVLEVGYNKLVINYK